MEPDKSVTSEEERTLENVSVEDGVSNVEKGDVNIPSPDTSNANATIGLSRCTVFAWAILTFVLLVGFVGSLSAALRKRGPEDYSAISADQALEMDNATSLIESLSFGDIEPPTFGKDILQGYSSKEDFEADLTNMAKYIVKNVILWNAEHTNVYDKVFETVVPTVGFVSEGNR
jgi:hypothetical protein